MKQTKSRVFTSILCLVLVFSSVSVFVSAADDNPLTFKINDGIATVTECKKDYSGSVIIPDEYDGAPITAIADKAFNNCRTVTGISFGKNIVTIGDNAFYDCVSLTSISLSKNVEKLGDYSFYNCQNLVSFTFNEKVTYIGKYAFGFCKKLTSVSLPESVLYVDACAFSGCLKLKTITVNGVDCQISTASATVPVTATVYVHPKAICINNLESGNFQYSLITCKPHIYHTVWTISKKETCTKDGLKYHECKYCYAITDKTVIPQAGHKEVNGVCTVCGVWLHKSEAPKLVLVSNTAKAIKLTWKALSGAESYRVYRKKSGGSWSLLDTVQADCLTFSDSTAKEGTNYVYTVKAVRGNETSSYDKTGLSVIRLTRPTVTAQNTTSGVKLTWSTVTGAKGYAVYKRLPGGSWSRIKTVTDASTLSCTDKNVNGGTTYEYTVKATNDTSASSYYNPGASIKYLKAPTLSSATSTKTGITVKWGKVTGAKQYNVYRKTTGGWTKLATVTTTSYLDKTAKKGTTYTYTVRAVNGSDMSSYYAGKSCKDIY